MVAGAILPVARPNALLIDCSTIDPLVTQQLAKDASAAKVRTRRACPLLAALPLLLALPRVPRALTGLVRMRLCVRLLRLRQARLVDAPVSGGVGGAAAGTLTFMVGGKYVRPSRRRARLSLRAAEC